jgi:hypothetical protein
MGEDTGFSEAGHLVVSKEPYFKAIQLLFIVNTPTEFILQGN